MELRSKPGQVDARKTRSNADFWMPVQKTSGAGKRIAAFFVLLTCWLAPLACSGAFVYPAALTATAGAPAAILPTVAGVAMIPSGTLPPVPSEITEMTPTAGMIGGGSIDPPSGSDPQTPAPTPLPRQQPILPRRQSNPGSPTPAALTTQSPPILYYTQAGDTLKALSARFSVRPEEITSREPMPTQGLFNPGVLLLIPPRLTETSSATPLLPDSELVYSPSALDFDISKFLKGAGGETF